MGAKKWQKLERIARDLPLITDYLWVAGSDNVPVGGSHEACSVRTSMALCGIVGALEVEHMIMPAVAAAYEVSLSAAVALTGVGLRWFLSFQALIPPGAGRSLGRGGGCLL